MLDADVLSSFSVDHGGHPQALFEAIKSNDCTVLLIPNEGEFKRLFGTGNTKDPEMCKLHLAGDAAAISGVIVV